MIKKIAGISILVICLFQKMAFAQQPANSTASYVTVNGDLDKANEFYAQGKYADALPHALEGYRVASMLSLRNELARACLVLSRIYRSQGNFNESMEFGLRSLKAAEGFSNEYTLGATISLIHLFGEWQAWEKELEYIKKLEAYTFADAATIATIQKEKYHAFSQLKRTKECIQVLEKLIETDHLPTKKYYLSELTIHLKNAGETSRALKNEITMRALLDTEGTDEEKAISENNIGSLYMDRKEFTYALIHFENALSYCKNESVIKGDILLNLSTALFRENQPSRSMGYLETAIEIYKQHHADRQSSLSLALKARIMSFQGDLGGALQTANQALEASASLEDPLLHSELYTLLSSITNKIGDAHIAAEFRQQASMMKLKAEENKKEKRASDAENLLAISNKEKLVFESISATEEARMRLQQQLEQTQREKDLAHLSFEKDLREAALQNEQAAREKAIKELEFVRIALTNEQQIRTISQLENERTAEQLKVSELSLQQQEKQRGLELLQKENMILEGNQKLKEIEIQNAAGSRKVRGLIIFSMSILLLFAFLGLYITRKKNKIIHDASQKVKEVNEQLQGQNEEIISSIHYARNFQDTIIPAEDQFRSHIGNSFLIYQPLDIVSGDIPFILKKENELFIGAIDCIGHGVPAAMLSFMAYYNLSELINEEKNANCGDLLSKLHSRLSESMKKRYANPNFAAGVDIGLCRLDLGNLKMQFAGANLPVLIVKKSATETIKGDMQSVGDIFNSGEVSFRTHERQLENSDRIYLLSDGFIHQFSDLAGKKKFSMKRLIQLLQSYQNQPMANVKSQILETFQAWKGQTPQTDDIVLIGLEPGTIS